jgi:Zn-finger protein
MKQDKKEICIAYAGVKSAEMLSWEKNYREKILKILQEKDIPLTLETIPEIIEATSFRNLSSSPEYQQHCSCYRGDPPKPCHSGIRNLNCFLCSCPNYDSGFVQINGNGNDSVLVGRCRQESRKGRYFPHPAVLIEMWDCSSCTAYHHPLAVEKYLREHMKELQKQDQVLSTSSSQTH